MALSFGNQKGSAKKSSLNNFQYRDGANSLRICGDILARYVYWVKGENDKNIPLECLSFDRDAEAFTNKEKDWVKEYYPDLKCGWSYVTQCIDNGEIKVVNLKKKLWESIINAAEDLGDPSDPVAGWDILFLKNKTGPLPYNVEYQLQALKCKPKALSKEDLALIENLKSMDEVMPRPTPDAQKALLDRSRQESTSEVDDTLEAEFN